MRPHPFRADEVIEHKERAVLGQHLERRLRIVRVGLHGVVRISKQLRQLFHDGDIMLGTDRDRHRFSVVLRQTAAERKEQGKVTFFSENIKHRKHDKPGDTEGNDAVFVSKRKGFRRRIGGGETDDFFRTFLTFHPYRKIADGQKLLGAE